MKEFCYKFGHSDGGVCYIFGHSDEGVFLPDGPKGHLHRVLISHCKKIIY